MRKKKYIKKEDGRFDIEAALRDLNKLRVKCLLGRGCERYDARLAFDELYQTICRSGYVIFRHHKAGDLVSTYTAKPNGNWVNYDPNKKVRGDCTTRSIYFTLAETVPYDTIREEQIKVARQLHWQYYAYKNARCAGWNTTKVWQQVLMDHGFTRIDLSRKVVRDDLAAMLVGCGRIVTHSASHCAAILDGTTYDAWDSTFKKCDYIFVKKSNWRKVIRALGELVG